MSSVVRLSSADTIVVKNVIERLVFNFASLTGNSNKFYIIELQEISGSEPYRIYTEYGRLGKNPRREGRYYSSRGQASNEFDRIVREKQGKGYVKVEVEDGFSFSSSNVVQLKGKTPKQDLSKINDKVLRLIGNLYQQATTFLASSIQTPIGSLTANQVVKGLNVLRKIEEKLDGKNQYSNFIALSDEFYGYIPVVFGSFVDLKKLTIDSYEKLNQYKDLLGVMESVVKAQDSLEKTLEDKYKSLNIKLKALSSRTKEYKRIMDKISNSHSRNHHFKMNVQNIFEIEDMVGFDKFNPYKVETMELFHGSRNENILSIMQNGLRIKPASAVHTGSMFGSGVYYASSVSKSAQYCWGFNGSASSDSYYMFICEVATGKIKDYQDAQPNLRSAPMGYNSVRGVAGKSLLHDEYIVYKESQSKLRYIIEFTKS